MMKATLLILVLGIVLNVGTTFARRTKTHGYKPKHNGTKHEVHQINIDAERGQIDLSSLANEFVHSLHEGIYLVNQAIQNCDEDTGFQNSLIEISNDVTDLAFSIQKDIHGDPRQLKYQIKSSIIFLSLLLPEVTELLHKHDNATFSNSLVREAMDSTLFAVQKLEVRTELYKKTNKELLGEVQTTFGRISGVLNNTNSEDKQVVEELHIQVHHLNHIIDKTVNKLEVWLHANTDDNENAKVIEEVAQNFGALTADLRKDISTSLTCVQLKKKIETCINTIYEQIQKLEQIEHNAEQTNKDHAVDILRNILFDGVAVARTLLIQLEVISKLIKT